MVRSSDFEGNFDGNSLNGGTWTEMTGSLPVGPANGQLTLFSSNNPTGDSSVVSGGVYKIPSTLVDSERVGDFRLSLDYIMTASPNAPHGNKMPDGFSISFGDTDTFKDNIWRPGTAEYEQGVASGLSVALIPYDGGNKEGRGNLVILWNGKVIGSTPFSGKGSYNSSAVAEFTNPLSISVSATGEVTVTTRLESLTATIPNNEWQTVDQTGWDFAVAGRTGANGGHAYVDNIHIRSEILICFVAGTLLACENGRRAVETLEIGDLVMTRDNGLQPVRWIGRRKLSAAQLVAQPAHRPVRLCRGTLGKGVPDRDLLVSPQHRILVRSPIAQKMCGATEVLVSAKHLCGIDGIAVAEDIGDTEYVHIMFDSHQIVISNGAESESLYAGKQVLTGLNAAAIREIKEIFPELADRTTPPAPIRYLASGREGRGLARRHAANNKPLLA